jgi:hypothetical protein
LTEQFRTFRRPPHLNNVPKAHDKDPRFSREPYSARYQMDQEQFAALDEQFRRVGFASFEEAYRALKLKNLPPLVRQVPFVQQIVTAGDVHILIPQNIYRMGFTVANPQTSIGNVTFAYGNFVSSVGGFPLGIVLGIENFFQESNGTVSIDDIYVTGDTDGMYVVGFEASLAIEGQGG